MADTQSQLGKYRLLKLLATGGMGEVFLARQLGPAGFSKTVVVKRMLTHLGRDPKFVQMFLNEARLAAALSHPNIVQIFELGEEDGTYFIAMEFIHGANLRALMRRMEERQAEMPMGSAAWICAQALKGLHHAHTLKDETGRQLHVVHRDVSPDNVLVGFDGTVKMVDFGIAKATTTVSTTNAGMVKGKYAYMAPEQLSGQPADPRTDVYAMGIVLYELLTGQRPFQGTSEGALVKAILQDAPTPLRTLRPNIPVELEEIIHRALARNPQERFPSAESMSAALEGLLLSLGRISQESIKALLRELFGEEADLTTVVNSLPKTGASNPVARSSASLKAGPSAEKKADPQQSTAPMQWVSVDLSTEFPVSQVKSTTTGSRAAAPPPQSEPSLPAANRTAGRLWAVFSTAVLLVGVGLTLLALRPPWAREPPIPSVVLPDAAQPSPLVTTTSLPPTTVAMASVPAASPAPEPKTNGTSEPPVPTPDTKTREREAPAGREARHTARPAAKPSTGTVVLRVNPWAEVFHADKTLGVTPMAPFELPSGTQTLTLKNKDLEVEKKIRVVVPANKRVELKVNLLDGM